MKALYLHFTKIPQLKIKKHITTASYHIVFIFNNLSKEYNAVRLVLS